MCKLNKPTTGIQNGFFIPALLVTLLVYLVPNSADAQALAGWNLTLDDPAAHGFVRFKAGGGFPPQYYEVVTNSTALNIHTETTRGMAGIQAPFKVDYRATQGIMTVAEGGVEIGSSFDGFASAPLHVRSLGPLVANSVPEAKIIVENSSHPTETRTMIEMINPGGARFGFTNLDSGRTWAFQNNASDGFLINLLGSGGNEFLIRKTGVISMGPGGRQNFVLDASGNLTILGTLNSASDRDRKKDFSEIDESKLLARISELPISSWTYKDDDNGVRHIGPMSQDFHEAFQVGKDDKTISVTDATGVALAGIKALNQRCEVLASQNQRLRQLADERQQAIESLADQMAELSDRLAAMESPSR